MKLIVKQSVEVQELLRGFNMRLRRSRREWAGADRG